MGYAVDHVMVHQRSAVAVHDFGGSGRPLVMVHATGFCAGMFAPIAARLPGFRSIGIDLAGHGDSAVPVGGDFSWLGFAGDVVAVLDALGIEEADAFGHSCGATTLLLAEQLRPGRFRKLYCYEPALGLSAGPAPVSPNAMSEGARRRRATFASEAVLREYFASKALFARFDREALDAYVTYGFAKEPDGSLSLKCSPESEASTFEHGGAHDCLSRLGEIGCPVMFAYGDAPDSFPAPMRRAVLDGLPGADYRALGGLGHLGPFENPARVAAELDRWFRS